MRMRSIAACCAMFAVLASSSSGVAAPSTGFPSGSTLGAIADLAVGTNPPEGPGYILAQRCVPGQPFVTLLLRVSNVGSITTPAIDDAAAITATVGLDPSWSTGTSLPALSTEQTTGVTLVLPARAGMSGTIDVVVEANAKHWFDEKTFANNRITIAVIVPPGMCPVTTASIATSAHTIGPTSTPTAAPRVMLGHGVAPATPPPTPVPKLAGDIHAKMAPQIPAPLNLQYTNNPSVCTAHSGLVGALICPSLLAAANSLVLVWDWKNCGNNDCRSVIDGYHIYKVSRGYSSGQYVVLPSRTLVDTQSDADLTVRGISPFKKTDCYVVTAYKGSAESPDSGWFCMEPQYGMGTESFTLTPWASQTRSAFNVACAHPSMYGESVNISSFGVSAGRQGFVSAQCSGDQLFQGMFAFNVAKVHPPVQKAVFSASLSLTPSCLDRIGLATRNWATENPTIMKTFQAIDPAWVLPLDVEGSSVTADVTNMLNQEPHLVGDYQDGATLWEFVVTGQSANWNDQLPSCQVQVDNIQLQVTQYK